MKSFRKMFRVAALSLLMVSCGDRLRQDPYPPLPSAEQLEWQRLEYVMKVEASEPASGTCDFEQWAKTAHQAGMRGIVFDIPETSSNIQAAMDLEAACRRYDLKMYTASSLKSRLGRVSAALPEETCLSSVSEAGVKEWLMHVVPGNVAMGLTELEELFYRSVGNNAVLLLSVPADGSGKIPETAVSSLLEFRALLNDCFHIDYAKMSRCLSPDVRGMKPRFSASNIVDGRSNTYWSVDDSVRSASFTVYFRKNRTVNRVMLQEPVEMGQRIRAFSIEGRTGEEDPWMEICRGTTVGYKKIVRFPAVEVAHLRVNILDASAAPIISNMAIYAAE